TLINSRHITLSPGGSYNFSQAFPVAAGQQTYSVLVSTPSGEAVSTDDDLSTATLNGLPDLVMISLAPQFGTPLPGQTVTMIATVQNTSNAAVGPFDVELFSGDPRFPQSLPTVLATQHVSGIAANGTVAVSFSGVSIPNAAGTYVFTALADPTNAIAESVEGNNDAQYKVTYGADPAVRPTLGVQHVTAVLLNTSGANNVRVTTPVSNLGNVTMTNIPLILQLSRDGADFVNVGTSTVTSLAPNTGTNVTFTTNGLSGDNIYRVIIDPSANALDANIGNNVDQAELIIHGLADLTVGTITLGNAQPQQGDTLTVSAVIQNLGIADANGILVELIAVPSGGPEIPLGSLHLDVVSALSQATATFTADTSPLAPGTYTLRVQVNSDHAVLESTELNNRNTIDLTVIAALPTNNVINALSGLANTIIIRRDPNGSEDDVWVNVPVTG